MNGNYLQKVNALAVQGKIPMGHASVLHDDWCDLLQGRGDCNCNPEVKLDAPRRYAQD